MQGNTESPLLNPNDPFIKSNKLLPILLILMGGISKFDLSKLSKTKILSKLYKFCILFLINFIYWRTILFPGRPRTALPNQGLELGVVTSIIGLNLNYIYATISLIMFLDNRRIQHAVSAHTSMRDILNTLDKVRQKMDVPTNIKDDGDEEFTMFLLEIASLFLMVSAQHFAYPFASYVNPKGMSSVSLYSYVLRSVLDHSFIAFIRRIDHVFENVERLLRRLTRKEGWRGSCHGRAMRCFDRKDLALFKVECMKSLMQLYR